MSKKQRVLIFSEDIKHVKGLTAFFPNAEVQYEYDVYHATKAYKNRPFDLLVADLDMDDEKAEDLLYWVSETYPLRKIIVTGGEDEDEYEELEDILQEKAVLGFLQKPIQEHEFNELLDQVEFGLAGRVQRTNVLDLLQALRMSQPQRLVIFKEVSSQKDGVIYLKNSNVIHAELYAPDPETREKKKIDEGDTAFYQILRFRNGQFEEKHWKEPDEVTIMLPFDNLAMNASTQIDESASPESAAEDINPTEIRSILLIDQDPMSRILIQKELFVEGFDCIAVKSMEEAIDLLKKNPSDLVVTDSLEYNAQKLGFLFWLNKHHPECPVVFLAPRQNNQNPQEEQEEAVTTAGGGIQILSKPVNLKTLKARIYDFAANGFKGYLNQIGVLEFIQLNLSAIDKKKLHIRDLSTGIDAKVFIDRGQIVHAEHQDLTGEEAFYKIVAIENGDFMEDPFYEQAGTSLTHILPHKLMLKASRYVPIKEAPPAPPPAEAESGGMTSLFGDDEPELNLGGGVTNLFGDDEPQLNLGGDTGGVTSLFGDDDIEFGFAPKTEATEAESGLHFHEEI